MCDSYSWVKNINTLLSIGLSIVALSFPLALPAVSAKHNPIVTSTDKRKPEHKYVTIPVLYVTDRNMIGETFGSRRRYPIHCQHDMYYGTAMMNVPNTHQTTDGEESRRLGWQLSDKPGNIKKASQKEAIDPKDPEAAKKAFFARLKAVLDQSGSDKLCMFVHGAADAFEDCAQDAAEMGYSMRMPVVLYSWPSNPKWRGYFVDGVNNEWSQGHFNMFLHDLIEFKGEHPLDVISTSHSMGNRLVIRSLPVVYGKDLISNWELLSPDIDADTTRHYIMGMKRGQSKINLFVSNRDKMLPLAQMLAGGYYRLGEAANPSLMPKDWQSSDLQNIQRIDFTNIDKGFEGHSIPFDLVSSIYHTGEPGDGLKLEPETKVVGNRMIRFIDRRHKLDAISSGLSPEFCKRVVREDKSK